MNFFLLINVKMPTIVGILTFMSGENSVLCLSEPKKAEFLGYFYTYEHLKCSTELTMNKFYNLGNWYFKLVVRLFESRFLTVNGAPQHTTFYYHSSSGLI